MTRANAARWMVCACVAIPYVVWVFALVVVGGP